jgi:hypothetical protein
MAADENDIDVRIGQQIAISHIRLRRVAWFVSLDNIFTQVQVALVGIADGGYGHHVLALQVHLFHHVLTAAPSRDPADAQPFIGA